VGVCRDGLTCLGAGSGALTARRTAAGSSEIPLPSLISSISKLHAGTFLLLCLTSVTISNGLMGEGKATFEKHFGDVTQTQLIAQSPQDCEDDVRGEFHRSHAWDNIVA
jgi:hypothetical protein